jgi:hypothetical protein
LIDHYKKTLKLLGNISYSIDPVIAAIKQDKDSHAARIYLVHDFPDMLETTLFDSLGEVIQCSKDFTLHDAYFAAANWVHGESDKVSFVDVGLSSFSEAFSIYRRGALVERLFGLDRSIIKLCENTLASSGLFNAVNTDTIDKHMAKSIKAIQEKHFALIYNHSNKRNVKKDYDTLAYQGAEVALRIEHSDLVTKAMKKAYTDVSDKVAVSLYTKLHLMMFVESFVPDEPVRFIGIMFKEPWMQEILLRFRPGSEFIYAHPGLGMYHQYERILNEKRTVTDY